MPDEQGWEHVASLMQMRPVVYHHPCDEYVTNTPKAKRDHEKKCPALLEQRRNAAAKKAQDRRERLRNLDKARKARGAKAAARAEESLVHEGLVCEG